MECYREIRDNTDGVISALKELNQFRNEEDYYRFRDVEPESTDPAVRVALFIYFNKMCYNGLYRVNKKGRFNVPWGKRQNAALYNHRNINDVAISLKDCELDVNDFEHILNQRATKNCFAYLDPPYHFPLSENGFTDYTSVGFDEEEQIRLSDAILEASDKGCKILLSNSKTPLILKLYSKKKGFYIEEVTAKRLISCNQNGRKGTVELLIRNYSGRKTLQERLN
jgi:DNA adenine methylase